MAEQFPEFVNAVQERLARRLLVHAEAEIIEAEARVGFIPAGKTIIRQDERGEALYLIARGVVRVSQRLNGEDRNLATLNA
jgi:CRP-like cAMP-binding protein